MKPLAPNVLARSKTRSDVAVMATLAPAAASALAQAKPMPSALPAPVTSATLPATPAMAVPLEMLLRDFHITVTGALVPDGPAPFGLLDEGFDVACFSVFFAADAWV